MESLGSIDRYKIDFAVAVKSRCVSNAVDIHRNINKFTMVGAEGFESPTSFDSGSGLASKFVRRELSNEDPLQDEYQAIVDCLKFRSGQGFEQV